MSVVYSTVRGVDTEVVVDKARGVLSVTIAPIKPMGATPESSLADNPTLNRQELRVEGQLATLP